ncbi:MAG TPA: hypothetical protein VNU71_21680, partial [Burkholderiaceae bacterium]|nr:hypothetical protein [Burkholderiaceae bacterium]
MSDARAPTVTLTSASGLTAVCDRAHGALQRLALGEVVVNLFVGNALEGGPANLVLRRHGERVTHTPLIGPRSPTRWRDASAAGRLEGSGVWQGLRYRIALQLAAEQPAWFWHVQVENTGTSPARIDLVALQDLALAPYAALRLNEFYVSQYLDHTPLAHPQRGTVLATRQNQAVGRAHPWCAIGSLRRAVGFATDALQVHGLTRRLGESEPGLAGDLPSTRLQHEHALAALQDARCDLAPGASIDLGFFGRLLADHPEATSAADLARVDETLGLAEAAPPAWQPEAESDAGTSAANLFTTAPLLAAREALPADLASWCAGSARRHEELDDDGRLLSFFHGADRHVALLAKERAVLRPHGQVLRTGVLALPDESALTSTAWMGGVFHSMLTQGHVSINRCLSTVRSYLGLFRSHGLRVFVELDSAWQLLDQPSAFEMAPDACRWLYRHAGGCIEVRSVARSEPHAVGLEVRVVDGPATRCLVCLHVALNGDDGSTASRVLHHRDGAAVVFAPVADSELGRRFPDGHWRIEPADGMLIEQVGGDELLFADRRSRVQPFLALVTAPAREARFSIVGRLVAGGVDVPSREAAGAGAVLVLDAIDASSDAAASGALDRLGELLPWLRQNALIHYLSPRGLEQFSGGGWG